MARITWMDRLSSPRLMISFSFSSSSSFLIVTGCWTPLWWGVDGDGGQWNGLDSTTSVPSPSSSSSPDSFLIGMNDVMPVTSFLSSSWSNHPTNSWLEWYAILSFLVSKSWGYMWWCSGKIFCYFHLLPGYVELLFLFHAYPTWIRIHFVVDCWNVMSP